MDFNAILSAHDAERARTTYVKLISHWPEPPVLTGGLAIELHQVLFGLTPEPRPLNDIDLLVESFEDIPRTLSCDLIFRHVHPHDPPGKTLLQSVDPASAVRVDVFRACGKTIARAFPVNLEGFRLRVVSVEDLTARTARLCMDLAQGVPVPAKHARDFLGLLPLAQTRPMDKIWQEHRKPQHPISFQQAANLLVPLIPATRDLQITPIYSQDVHQTCSRCESANTFPLADASRVLTLLGYC